MENLKKDVQNTGGQVQQHPDYITKMSNEIQRLLKEGKSMQEAIALTQHLIPRGSAVGNRTEYIKSLNSIEAVKKALHGAHAKLSKAKDAATPNAETISRYEEEIETAKTRKNELIAQINKSGDSLKMAMDLGTSNSGICQMIVEEEEAKAKDILAKAKKALGWTNKGLKDQLNATATETPEYMKNILNVHPEVIVLYEKRLAGEDRRVETLNRRWNLINKLAEKAKGNTITGTTENTTTEQPIKGTITIEDKKEIVDNKPITTNKTTETAAEIKAKAEAAKKEINDKLAKRKGK